jgi:DNA-binding response OmpR family regulator
MSTLRSTAAPRTSLQTGPTQGTPEGRRTVPSGDLGPSLPEAVRVLVVEDENLVRRNLRAILQRSGFSVLEAETGEQGLDCLEAAHPAVVLLDIMLPGIDGFETCRRMRTLDSETAILMLTAKNQDVDKVRGLEAGADDYIVKPFNPEELVARIKAVLRRSGGQVARGNSLRSGPFRLELPVRKCFKHEREIELTPKELALLTILFQNPDKTLSRAELCRGVWGERHFGSDNALDVYVRKLREKLEDDPSRPVHLKTAWGLGYVWR